jgi:phosphoserine phosphatase RsbU/P
MNTFAPAVDLHTLEKLREQELEEARAIQSVMLPAESLCACKVTVSHKFQPVTEVGGDFLDYFELTDGTIGAYLGDVSGKGLPAAMYAALTVGTLRGVHKTGQTPSHVLATLNRRLMIRGVPRRHAAIQYAVFDPRSNDLQIASAGMPGPLHFSGKDRRVLELSGIPPGLFEFASYETSTLRLEAGDSVLFCTDGITDAMNKAGENFGIERLSALYDEQSSASPGELLSEIFSAVSLFSRGREQHDDMAAALLQYRG